MHLSRNHATGGGGKDGQLETGGVKSNTSWLRRRRCDAVSCPRLALWHDCGYFRASSTSVMASPRKTMSVEYLRTRQPIRAAALYFSQSALNPPGR